MPDIMPFDGYEWDPAKDLANQAKHGVSFEQAQYAFDDPRRVIAADTEHGDEESRCFCFGRVAGGVLTVRYTQRGDRIRIIGAGYWRKGRAAYEKANTLHG